MTASPRSMASAHCGSLRRSGVSAALIAIPHGERSKRAATIERLWLALGALGLGRRDVVIALGGGVVGDVAGFAAATWLRGVPWIGVPSTVMAQVDSALGGKTGIDLPSGKNLVGAFHQPARCPGGPAAARRHCPYASAAPGSPRWSRWAWRATRRCSPGSSGTRTRWPRATPPRSRRAVTRALAVKARVVRRDEREREGGGRTALNFGHTLGHAIEAARGYRGLLHGEAVAIGMRVAAALSVRAARTGSGRARSAGARARPPRAAGGACAECGSASWFVRMRADKKRRPSAVGSFGGARVRATRAGGWDALAREVRWVLTPRVGHASVPRLVSGRLLRAVLIEAGARP